MIRTLTSGLMQIVAAYWPYLVLGVSAAAAIGTWLLLSRGMRRPRRIDGVLMWRVYRHITDDPEAWGHAYDAMQHHESLAYCYAEWVVAFCHHDAEFHHDATPYVRTAGSLPAGATTVRLPGDLCPLEIPAAAARDLGLTPTEAGRLFGGHITTIPGLRERVLAVAGPEPLTA